MKTRNLLMIALFALTSLSFGSNAFAQDAKKAQPTYKVDPVHSNVLFRVKHTDISFIYGQFLKFDGTVKYDPAKVGDTSIAWTVQTDSVFTNQRQRDEHLKNADFFNAGQYPTITFKSKKVTRKGADKFEVVGDLTLNGVTRPVTTLVTVTGNGKDQEGKDRYGFHTEFSIERSKHGMAFMVGPVSDKVDLTVSTQVVAQ
ncbi:MAG: YceI family protein [Bradymonadaceae bacterium]